MDRIRKLADLVRQLEDQLAVCMRCGLCQAVCPVFAETGRESDVARGKLALLDGLIHEMFKDPRGVNERINRCLLCGSCAANCPSGVKVIDIFIKARAILTAYVGMNPVKRALFRGLLARPRFFDALLEFGARFQHLFAKPADELLGTSCGRVLSPLAERHFKTLAPVPFHKIAPAVQAGRASGIKAAFFTGCLVDKIYPNIGQAVLRALGHHGVSVLVPGNQGCCGIPALSAGDGTTFGRLVEYSLGRFDENQFDYLITACATCTATIRKLWPAMALDLSGDQFARVKAIAEKTLDISEFLVDVLGVGEQACTAESGTVLTYHDPCHLKKSLGIAAQPRALLRTNPQYSFKEMAEADRCCGCGGSFTLQYHDMSAAIGRRKRDCIIQSGSAAVATGCPACMLQITDMLSRAGDRVQVNHTIEIYADALGRT